MVRIKLTKFTSIYKILWRLLKMQNLIKEFRKIFNFYKWKFYICM